MTYAEVTAALTQGVRFTVRCPDGVQRVLWGYNPATGDAFIAGWTGPAWALSRHGKTGEFYISFNAAD